MSSCFAIHLHPRQLVRSHRNPGFLSSNLDIRDPPGSISFRIKQFCHKQTLRSYNSSFIIHQSVSLFRTLMNRDNHLCPAVLNSGNAGIGPEPDDTNVLNDAQNVRASLVDQQRTYVTLESEATSEGEEVGSGDGDISSQSNFDFMKLRRELEESTYKGLDDSEDGKENFTLPRGSKTAYIESDEEEEKGKIFNMRGWASGRQMLKRSTFLAKQVISIRSACSLGFISQLWVDTKSWLVVVVEVRPSILSGESEKILLEDVTQVGDVVLIEDESVTEIELKLIGLDTLIGYNVVTVSRRNIGKVRDLLFNINSGAVESLELDSFGTSLIPSSLISTYSLLVEDILEVVSDKIVVHDETINRIQRLTKGFWDTLSAPSADDDTNELSGYKRRNILDRRTQRKLNRRKAYKMRGSEDEWDLPMEY